MMSNSVQHSSEHTETCIRKMLEEQSFGVVSTLRQQQSFQHIISHSSSQDLRYIYFANDSSNALAINITQQPQVNVIWDNRTGDVEDEALNAYVTASGFANKLGEMKARMASSMLLERNPNLAEQLTKPLVKIYCIQVHTYHYHYSDKDTDLFYPNKAHVTASKPVTIS